MMDMNNYDNIIDINISLNDAAAKAISRSDPDLTIRVPITELDTYHILEALDRMAALVDGQDDAPEAVNFGLCAERFGAACHAAIREKIAERAIEEMTDLLANIYGNSTEGDE